jgi:hypothetical protein
VSACRLGVLAFGDSITNGGGELQWGVALQSWALWVARGLGLPYTPHAQDGATVQDVVEIQIPRARADTRYDLGCLYVGANDARLPGWDRTGFERDHRAALAFLAERCDRVLTATVPLDLGRPRAGAAVLEANAAIEASAANSGALVLDLRDFKARNLMMPDGLRAGRDRRAGARPPRRARARAARPALEPDQLRDDAPRPPAGRPDVPVPPREGLGARRGAQCFRVSSSTSTPSWLRRRGT